MKKIITLGVSIFVGVAFSQAEESPSVRKQEPWHTGSLIAPYGTVVPYGSFLIRSYLYSTTKTGFYDKNWNAISLSDNFHSLVAQFQCFFGITPWCDINLIPEFIYNFTLGNHYFNSGDLKVGLDFQLLKQDHGSYFPGIKFAIREVFPTGNFQCFTPKKEHADRTGEGCFATEFDLIFYKVFSLSAPRFISITVSSEYTVNTPVNVHGFNSYGGGFGTRGKVIPGNSFQAIVGFEAFLSQNFALALDTVYKQVSRTSFYGIPGIVFSGDYANVESPSSKQLSFAPAIEYNFSKKLGIIVGAHLSAIGKNSDEFRSGIVNIQYTY